MSEKYRATLYVDRELWNWLRKHSIDQQQSASEIIEELIRTYSTQIMHAETKQTGVKASRTKSQKRG